MEYICSKMNDLEDSWLRKDYATEGKHRLIYVVYLHSQEITLTPRLVMLKRMPESHVS